MTATQTPPAVAPANPHAHHQPLSITGPAVIAIILSLLGWTTIPIFLRYFAIGEQAIDAWTANGWRYAISALIWLPAILISLSRGTMPPNLWRAALVPAFWNSAAQVCFALAPYYVDPGLMTFSMRLQIIFLALGAALMFPAERRVLRSPAFLVCLGVVLVATMSTVALNPKGLGSGQATGILLAIAAGVMYALYALAVRKHMTGINPIKAFAVVSQYTAAALVACMLFLGQNHGWHAVEVLDTNHWLLLIASSVIGIGLGHTFYFYSIARLGVVVASGIVQLQPITVAAASSLVFPQVKMTPAQWATGTVAVAGAVMMLVVQSRLLKKPAPPRPE